MRIRFKKEFFTSITGLTILGVLFAFILTTVGIYTWYYVKYSKMIEARLVRPGLAEHYASFFPPRNTSPPAKCGPSTN